MKFLFVQFRFLSITIFHTKYFKQGMYKNRVKNDIIFFENLALLSCDLGNPEQENSKQHIYFEFCFSVFC